MEISAIEIHLLCKKISESVSDYFVSGIYSMEQGAMIRLNHSSKPEKLVAISSFANWITTKNLTISQATKFVSRLRVLERVGLHSVEQVGNERIARFSFVSRKGEKRILYAEFFSHGNLILTDPEANDSIIDVENPQTFRHRSLVVGEKYVLPPTRGISLQDIDLQKLLSAHSTAIGGAESLSAVRWFGRTVGTSRKFVEEIFFRANVDPETPAKSLLLDDLHSLADACDRLRSDLQISDTGYILVPNEDSDLDIDVCQIVPNSWKTLSEQGLATIRAFPSLSEALDEVQVQSLVLDRKRFVSKKARAKASELASAIAKQASQIELNKAWASELREEAKRLMSLGLPTVGPESEIAGKLKSYDLIEVSENSGNQARFVTEPRSFLKSYSGTALASRLFDEAKRMDSETRSLEKIMLELEDQKGDLLEKTRTQEEKAERKMVTERRERQWFERYRWFVTSNGKLALGGRDSTSNSIVVNKYVTKNDIVFHADLHGSPFFVLRNRDQQSTPPSDDVALEMSQATVGFSRAWKDELGSADAYWVYPDQIKKGAPSGEYLPRGSFFIEGKKNFVRHVKVELSVGIMSSSDLPEGDGKGLEDSNEEKPADVSELLVVCGPEKSIANYCYSTVRIAPGKEKASYFAKRLKQQLVNKIKESEVKESSKKLQLDDIMRALPSGTYKFVAEKQNN